jgi:hypothetical protein
MINIINNKLAVIHLYEIAQFGNPSYMRFYGAEFFDRSGRSLIRVGSTTIARKEIRLQEDEKVIGV